MSDSRVSVTSVVTSPSRGIATLRHYRLIVARNRRNFRIAETKPSSIIKMFFDRMPADSGRLSAEISRMAEMSSGPSAKLRLFIIGTEYQTNPPLEGAYD